MSGEWWQWYRVRVTLDFLPCLLGPADLDGDLPGPDRGKSFRPHGATARRCNAAVALDILAERYARGELTREEFTRMNKELGDIAPRKSRRPGP